MNIKRPYWLSGDVTRDVTIALSLNDGLSLADLFNYFSRNKSSKEIRAALDYLLSIDKIEVWKEKTRGRTKTIIYLKK